jgi:glycosyltransferase involved in cell wall biosynthesis
MDASKPQPTALLLCPATGARGGTQQVVLSIARSLRSRGVQVRTVFPDHEGALEAVAWFEREGVPGEINAALRQMHVRRSWRDVLALRDLIRAAGPDVVNIHYGVNYISVMDALAVRLAGVQRSVVAVHHATPDYSPRTRLMTRAAGHLCRTVIVHTDVLRRQLVGVGVPAAKIHVLPYGVPMPETVADRAAARSALGLPPDAFVVATVARLVPEKGIADLIEALGRLDDANRLRLVVVGDGPARPTLEARAAERLKSRVHFLGDVPALDPVYGAADAFCLPSYAEGFGLVFIEAALYGLPRIGFAVGGVPEAIQNGTTGLLVPAGDLDALTDALRRLRDAPELRRKMGRAAHSWASARYTEAHMVEGYARLLLDE